MSIPASALVSVTPSVLNAGGTALDMNGLVLADNALLPVGSVVSLANPDAVASYFGADTPEHLFSQVYFLGFSGSTVKPGELLFSRYALEAGAPAWLRSGRVSGLSLTELKAISGTLNITVNGVARNTTIDLAPAVSFSDAAQIIQTALGSFDAVVTGSIAATTLTVTALSSGELAIGQVITGVGVTPGTRITAFLTGTGGTGTYTVSESQTVSSTTISSGQTTVAYNSTQGAFIITGGTPSEDSTITVATGTAAAPLRLNLETGAVVSQGVNQSAPNAYMTSLVGRSQNWAVFTTLFEADLDDKVDFAEWTNAQNKRYLYAMWDTSEAPTTSNDTTSAGYLVYENEYGGVAPLYQPVDQEENIAAFLMGAVASLDFGATNGRATMASRRQEGFPVGVEDLTVASNLIANGYSFYGDYATANDNFRIFQNGQVSGEFKWTDSYVGQIWLNNAFQLALMTLLVGVNSIPYNADGYTLIEASLTDPINAALNFGTIRTGVTLSALQAAQVNAEAGQEVAQVIETRGWYLQVLDPTPQVRAARGSPPIKFWYTDGGSVQTINMASIAIQ